MSLFFLVVDLFKILPLVALFQVIGKFFYSNWTISFDDLYVKGVIELIFGFFLSVVFYSIITANGKTINSLILLILVWHYIGHKIEPNFAVREYFKKQDAIIILHFILSLIVFFLIQLWRHDFFNNESIKLGWGDIGFYSNLSEQLLQTGIEKVPNWFHFFNSPNIQYSSNPVPYHFFDLWINTILLNISSNSGVFVYIFIFIPFITSLVSVSFIALINKLSQNKLNHFIYLAIAVLFTFYVGKLPFKEGGVVDNLLNFPKVFVFYLNMVLFVLFHKMKQRNSAYFLLAITCFMNVIYLPTICVLLAILFLFDNFFNRNKNFISLALLVFLTIGFIVFFKVIFPLHDEYKITSSNSLESYLRNGFTYYFRGSLARVWFFYFPLSLFIFFQLFYAIKNKSFSFFTEWIIVAFFSLHLVSLFFTSFFPHVEAFQFNSSVLNPLATIATLVVLVRSIDASKFISSKIIILFVVIQAIYSFIFIVFTKDGLIVTGRTNYSKQFLEEISQYKFTNKLGGFIIDTSILKSNFWSNNPNLSHYTSVMDVKDNGFAEVSLSVPIKETEIQFQEMKGYILNSPLYKFAANKQILHGELDQNSLIIDFIKEYKIAYVIIEPKVNVPRYLQERSTRIITDSLSNLRIVCLQ